MTQPARIARLAVHRVVHLIETVEHACEDGIVTPMERRMIRATAHDARVTVEAANASDELSRAIGRATSERRITALTAMYQAACDELPDAA